MSFAWHAPDVRPEPREAVPDQPGVVVELRRAVDQVHGVEVDGEARAVDRLQQREVAVHGVRQAPRHRLQRVVGPPRADGVDDLAHRVDDERERVRAQVVGMRPVPRVGQRAGQVDAAARVDLVGEGEPPLAQLHRGGAGGVVPAQRVVPHPDLRDHDVGLRRRARVGGDLVGGRVVAQRPVRRAEAAGAHGGDPPGGRVPCLRQRRAEAHGGHHGSAAAPDAVRPRRVRSAPVPAEEEAT